MGVKYPVMHMAHIGQSRPYSGLGFQVEVVFPSCSLFAWKRGGRGADEVGVDKARVGRVDHLLEGLGLGFRD